MKKPRKRTTLKEDIAKYLLDVSKLVLVSIVISGILRRDLPQDLVLISGIAVVIVSLILGIALGKKRFILIKRQSAGRKGKKDDGHNLCIWPRNRGDYCGRDNRHCSGLARTAQVTVSDTCLTL